MIHRLRPRIQQIVDALLDDATGKSEIEFMTNVRLENAGRGSRVAGESEFSWFEETASVVVSAVGATRVNGPAGNPRHPTGIRKTYPSSKRVSRCIRATLRPGP